MEPEFVVEPEVRGARMIMRAEEVTGTKLKDPERECQANLMISMIEATTGERVVIGVTVPGGMDRGARMGVNRAMGTKVIVEARGQETPLTGSIIGLGASMLRKMMADKGAQPLTSNIICRGIHVSKHILITQDLDQGQEVVVMDLDKGLDNVTSREIETNLLKNQTTEAKVAAQDAKEIAIDLKNDTTEVQVVGVKEADQAQPVVPEAMGLQVPTTKEISREAEIVISLRATPVERIASITVPREIADRTLKVATPIAIPEASPVNVPEERL